ncbi:FadR/GntR family transcriptional regulator [Gracilibacillus alcaliphilus]|uniref:FadR/GntR family transcriptional regulator n=1 Tax=Gracilibacillus alcaliphilus TaxID=1401441 RepID=UPI00195DCF2F|nr:GntR family transcriptional regulator [Gracilibacillus alcaliphilus]MBM7677126.1 GntR family transcriptional repressor for pyruvate dehydrogenase complex [Gracilibacillus alcaliphilus]
MKPIDIEERKSLKTTIIQEIKQYIIEHNLKAGDKLPAERKFMEIFGVSRSVIREALSYLENTGVIRVRQGQGAFLNKTNIENLLDNFFFLWQINGGNISDIQSLRAIFETSAIDEIYRQKQEDALLTLKQQVQTSRHATTETERKEADRNFHSQLLKATNNELFIQISHMITSYFFSVAAHITLTEKEFHTLHDEHEEIVDLLIEGNIEEAKRKLTIHIDKTKKS